MPHAHHRLLVRILEPQDEATRYVDSFDLSASFTLPATTEDIPSSQDIAVPKIEVLLEEYSGPQTRLRAGLILSAERLTLSDTERGNRAFLESFEILPDQTLIRDPDQLLCGLLGQIRARINISALRPEPGETPRLFSLKLLARDAAHTTISNEVRFTLQPRHASIPFLGGFLSHPDATLHSRVLFLEGWAMRSGDEVLSVEIFANDSSLGYANCNLPSPKQFASLPDFPESRLSRFAFCLDYEKRNTTSVAEADWQKMLHLSALVEFSSGHKERISGVATRWLSEPIAGNDTSVLIGGLDSIGYAANGMLQIEGYMVHDAVDEPDIVVSWRNRELLAEEHAGTLIRKPDVDIARRYPSLAHAMPRFCIQIAPEAFGRIPGRVEVLLRSKVHSAEISLGPKGILSSIPELLERSREENSKATRIAQSIIEKGPVIKAGGSKPSLQRNGSSRDSPHAGDPTLFATHNLSVCEGAPRVLLQVVEDMVEQGRKCLVVSPENGELGTIFEAKGIPVFIIPELATLGQDWLRYHRGLNTLQSIVSEYMPGLVYANVLDSFWGIDIGSRNGIKTIWAIHESVYPETCFQDMEFSLRTRFLNLLPQVDKAVFVTNATAALFSELIPRERREVIPNAIHVGELDKRRASITRDEARKELGIAEHEHVISVIGTTTKRKGQDVFIKEMALLKELCPEVALRFFIVGARDIPFLTELRELARRLKLDRILTFVYETPNVAQYYVASDVIVISSREESAPLVSLEAFAFERPLVSTTAFGLAEQIDHETNALSYKLNDQGALAKAVQRIILDTQLRAKLIAGGRETLVSRFSYERNREQYRGLLNPPV